MLDSLPAINHDQRSQLGQRSASVLSTTTLQATDGPKLKSIKFVYSSEVLRCFQKVLRQLDSNVIGSAGPIRVDNAGRFYKPSETDVRIVKFPTIYTDLLSMRRKKHGDAEQYVRKKISECTRHAEAEDLLLLKKPPAEEGKKSRKTKATQLDRESTMTSQGTTNLPTIFELTNLQTPRRNDVLHVPLL